MPDGAPFSGAREEDGSPHVEKNYIGTPPLISERADIILILKSRAVSSEKRRPLSQPAAEKEKWPSDLIYERTNEQRDPGLLFWCSRSLFPLLSSPLLSPARHRRDSFLLAEFATAATACSNAGRFLGKSRDELPPVIKSLLVFATLRLMSKSADHWTCYNPIQ